MEEETLSSSEPEISWENEVYCRDRELNEFIRDYRRRQGEMDPSTINHSSVCFTDRRLDPQQIQRYIPCEYKKSKLPTVVIRRDDATISICRGQRVKMFGVKSWCKIVYNLQCLRHMLSSIAPGENYRFGDIINMNIVAQTSIDPKYTRDSISNMNIKYPHDTSYRPVLHPSCNFYHQCNPVFTASIYDTGFISIAGLKTREQKREALAIVYQRIARSIEDEALREEFIRRYIEPGGGATAWGREENPGTAEEGGGERRRGVPASSALAPAVASVRDPLTDEHKTEFIKLQNVYKKRKLFNASKLRIHKQKFVSRLDRHRLNERESHASSIFSRIKNSYYMIRRCINSDVDSGTLQAVDAGRHPQVQEAPPAHGATPESAASLAASRSAPASFECMRDEPFRFPCDYEFGIPDSTPLFPDPFQEHAVGNTDIDPDEFRENTWLCDREGQRNEHGREMPRSPESEEPFALESADALVSEGEYPGAFYDYEFMEIDPSGTNFRQMLH